MVPPQSGWRTARHVAPVPQPPRPDATVSASSPRPTAQATGRRLPAGNLSDAAKWSIAFVAILGYVYSAVTYGLPLVGPSVVVALLGLFFERVRIVFPTFLVLFALWVVWSAIGVMSSYQRDDTITQVTVLLKVLVIVFAIVNVVHNAWRVRMFIIFFLGCFALYPARGTLVNYFISGYTMFGRALWNFIYGNSNDLAALTFFPLSLTLALIITEKKGWVKNVSFLGAGLLTLIILLTQSRGALIALVATGLIYFLNQARGKRIKTLLTTMVVAVLIGPLVPSSAWQRFSGISKLTDTSTIAEADPEGSADARYNIWRVARDPIECARANSSDQAFLEDPAETGRMLRVQPQIFVHVEDGYPLPGDSIPGLQRLIERSLGVAGGEDRRRRAALGDRLAQDRCQVIRRSRRERRDGVEHAHTELIIGDCTCHCSSC